MKHAFLLGAAGYPLLELLYRRRTHYSMAIAGGCAMLLIERIRKTSLSLPRKAALCAAGITGVEYLCGLVWNRHYQVWDYRRRPLNLHGQICLPYTILWGILSAMVITIADHFPLRKKRTD